MNISSELRKVQNCQLDLALEVKRICDKNDILYFIVDGTALGAVKYGGFIPWDDDLDIGMYRDDYYKFITACEKELSSEYLLQNISTDENYGNCFSQLRIRQTKYTQEMWGGANGDGIFIDIHPFIPLPENKLLVKAYCVYFKILKHILLEKTGVRHEGLPYKVLHMYSRILKKDKIVSRINKIFKKFRSDKCTRAYKIAGRHLDKDCIYIDNLERLTQIAFEGHQLNIMPDYDRMLKSVYGDYLNTIPEGNLLNRHGIVELDFGNYLPKANLKK